MMLLFDVFLDAGTNPLNYCRETRSTIGDLASRFFLCATAAAHKQEKKPLWTLIFVCIQLTQVNFGEHRYFFYLFSFSFLHATQFSTITTYALQ